MFVLKSTHNSVKALYEARIADLHGQLADLKRLVFIPMPTHSETLPIRAANAILDGQEVMPTQDPAQEATELREANRILSGDYDAFGESTF